MTAQSHTTAMWSALGLTLERAHREVQAKHRRCPSCDEPSPIFMGDKCPACINDQPEPKRVIR